MTPEELKAAVESVWWWHSIEIPGYGLTPGHEPNSRSRDAYMNIPWAELNGKTVLDIGAWDGLYSFLAEEAGAEKVIAADQYIEKKIAGADQYLIGNRETAGPYLAGNSKVAGIKLARDLRGSSIEIRGIDIENRPLLWPQLPIDVCFFFGVLYHLQNPLRALHNVAASIKPGGLLILETATTARFIDKDEDFSVPFLELCEGERDGDATNWSYPNIAWVEAALRIVGFEQIECQGGISNRAAWHARKRS